MKLCVPLMLASCYALALPAMAGTEIGTVKDLFVRDSDGLIWVDLTQVPGSGGPFGPERAACAVTRTYWMIPNETTDTGKRLFAMLLAAQLGGRVVTIHGKGTCNRWPDGEDIETVNFD